ncbi:MAG: hypothetical protein R3B70_33445 [Polyangiaceae bacterium]
MAEDLRLLRRRLALRQAKQERDPAHLEHGQVHGHLRGLAIGQQEHLRGHLLHRQPQEKVTIAQTDAAKGYTSTITGVLSAKKITGTWSDSAGNAGDIEIVVAP